MLCIHVDFQWSFRPGERWAKVSPWLCWRLLQDVDGDGHVFVSDLEGLPNGYYQLHKVGKQKLGNPVRWRGWWPAQPVSIHRNPLPGTLWILPFQVSICFLDTSCRRAPVTEPLLAAAERWSRVLVADLHPRLCALRKSLPGCGAADAQATESQASLGGLNYPRI